MPRLGAVKPETVPHITLKYCLCGDTTATTGLDTGLWLKSWGWWALDSPVWTSCTISLETRWVAISFTGMASTQSFHLNLIIFWFKIQHRCIWWAEPKPCAFTLAEKETGNFTQKYLSWQNSFHGDFLPWKSRYSLLFWKRVSEEEWLIFSRQH